MEQKKISPKKITNILGIAWLQQTKAVETSKFKKEVPHLQQYSHEKAHLQDYLWNNLCYKAHEDALEFS